METKIIEATNGKAQNWGKFLVGRFTTEWSARSTVMAEWNASQGRDETTTLLLREIGWNPQAIWVLDLQTCEGAAFKPGGLARADLNKHRIWVCPLFEPFLAWLYQQDLKDLQKLPDCIDLPNAAFDFAGYRRPGPEESR